MPRPSKVEMPLTLSIPEAGKGYFGLSKNGSYDAAARGEIAFVRVGRLKRVPVLLMDRKMQEADPASRPHAKASAR